MFWIGWLFYAVVVYRVFGTGVNEDSGKDAKSACAADCER